MMRSQQLLLVASCGLALAACGPAIQHEDYGFGPPAAAEDSRIVVRNDYFGELDVFVVMGSMRTRLGSVPAGGKAKFSLPQVFFARPEIQFQVDPVGPDAPFTYRPITLVAGNVIELAVAPALQMSSLAIVRN